jgi:uncharacterized alkaline shock family protein YloU
MMPAKTVMPQSGLTRAFYLTKSDEDKKTIDAGLITMYGKVITQVWNHVGGTIGKQESAKDENGVEGVSE